MKWFKIFAVGSAVCCALTARADLVSGISVVVNDSVITFAEIEDQVMLGATAAAQVYANDPQGYSQQVQKLRAQDIEMLVEDKLIVHEFTSAGYTTNVLEAFIEDRIKDIIHRDYLDDRTRLIKTLYAKGITYEQYRRQQREQFIVEYMNYQNNSNVRKIIVSPLKIEQYYNDHKDEYRVEDQVHLRMIVVNKEDGAPDDRARKVAEEILRKVDSGVSFAEMAGVYSSSLHRAEGGDRGWEARSDFKPELAKVAFSLKPGQHSDVIDLPEACYLLMVEEARPAHNRPLAEMRDEIERTLRGDESQRLRKEWIERLKRKSFIQYY